MPRLSRTGAHCALLRERRGALGSDVGYEARHFARGRTKLRAMFLLVWLTVVVGMLCSHAIAAKPSVTVDTPKPGETLYTRVLTVAGTAEGAVRVHVCMTGPEGTVCKDSVEVPRWSVQFDLGTLPAGTYTINVTAFDETGAAAYSPELTLTLNRLDATVLAASSAIERYVQPAAAVLGVISALAVLLRPGWFRLADGVGALVGGLTLSTIAMRLLEPPFSPVLALAASLVLVLLVAQRFAFKRQARSHG